METKMNHKTNTRYDEAEKIAYEIIARIEAHNTLENLEKHKGFFKHYIYDLSLKYDYGYFLIFNKIIWSYSSLYECTTDLYLLKRGWQLMNEQVDLNLLVKSKDITQR